MKNTKRDTLKLLGPTDNHVIRTKGYRSITIFIFLLIAVYCVLPFIDVPLLGLSVSAPLFFFVALEVLLRAPEPWFSNYRLWIIFAIFNVIGILFSFLGGALITKMGNFNLEEALYVIRYAYWLLFFVVTAYFVSYNKLWWRLIRWLAIAVTVLAILRWSEALHISKFWDASGRPFLTPNGYGILFSTFASMLLPFLVSGRKRFLAFLAISVLWSAAAINGSRSSWISIVCGAIVFFIIYLQSRSKVIPGVMALIGTLLFFLAIINFAPDSWIRPIEARFSTFQMLEEDKSFVIRQVLVKKGLYLFQSNPFFGVGMTSFLASSAEVDMPALLVSRTNEILTTRDAHNSYILFLSETGLTGTLPFASMLLYLIWGGYKAAASLSRQGEIWSSAVFSSLVGMSIHFWTLSGMTSTVTWLIYGLVAGMIWFDKSKHQENIS